MRIVLVSQEYPPAPHGGIGSQAYLKAHGLASLGHDVVVLSHSQDEARASYREGSIHIVRIPSYDHRLPIYTEPARWVTYSCEVAAALAQLQANSPADIIDFAEWGCEGYVHLLNRTEWNRVPTVIQLHGPLVMFAHTMGWPDVDSEFYRVGTSMEATCLRSADAIFSSSRCSADWCARNYGLDKGAIPILHTGVDIDLFHPRDIPKESRPTIIFVGRIATNKGVDQLLEASCLLAKQYPELQLRLIGNDESGLVEGLRKRAREQGLLRLVDHVGYVSQRELPEYLSGAHVFAAPSIYEGGPGFVYLEAMACGLPVVACDGSGAAEAVIHGENGFLVPPGDIEKLVEVLRQLLANSGVRAEMGRRASRYVVEYADSRICIQKLADFYASVLKRVASGQVTKKR